MVETGFSSKINASRGEIFFQKLIQLSAILLPWIQRCCVYSSIESLTPFSNDLPNAILNAR